MFAKSKPSPELYLQMAKLYEAGGKLPAAEQAYQQGLKSFPKNVELHLAWARLKHRQGQTQEALDLYQKAAKLAPNDASVHNDLGVFYARQGKSKEAIAAYERAIQLQPKKSLYRHNLVMVLVDTGQNDKAMTHLKAVHSEAEACYKLGYLLQKKEQWQQASEYFARAVALNPSMQEAKVWLDHVQAQYGRRLFAAGRPGRTTSGPSPAARRAGGGAARAAGTKPCRAAEPAACVSAGVRSQTAFGAGASARSPGQRGRLGIGRGVSGRRPAAPFRFGRSGEFAQGGHGQTGSAPAHRRGLRRRTKSARAGRAPSVAAHGCAVRVRRAA